jgi:hypothetical protein
VRSNSDFQGWIKRVGSQGDSRPNLEEGHRCSRPDRPTHSPGRHSEQGPVRPSDSHERGAKDRTSRVCRNDLDADQHLLDPERKVEGDVAASHRQLVLAMVSARRARRQFESQRPTQIHHQYREEDIDCWRVSPGCSDVGRAHDPPIKIPIEVAVISVMVLNPSGAGQF